MVTSITALSETDHKSHPNQPILKRPPRSKCRCTTLDHATTAEELYRGSAIGIAVPVGMTSNVISPSCPRKDRYVLNITVIPVYSGTLKPPQYIEEITLHLVATTLTSRSQFHNPSALMPPRAPWADIFSRTYS